MKWSNTNVQKLKEKIQEETYINIFKHEGWMYTGDIMPNQTFAKLGSLVEIMDAFVSDRKIHSQIRDLSISVKKKSVIDKIDKVRKKIYQKEGITLFTNKLSRYLLKGKEGSNLYDISKPDFEWRVESDKIEELKQQVLRLRTASSLAIVDFFSSIMREEIPVWKVNFKIKHNSKVVFKSTLTMYKSRLVHMVSILDRDHITREFEAGYRYQIDRLLTVANEAIDNNTSNTAYRVQIQRWLESEDAETIDRWLIDKVELLLRENVN